MGNTYASSDWHGNGVIGKKILSYLQPHDTLYFLGDCIDRGPDGIELFNLLYNDPRVIMLKGNHEQLMYDSLYNYLKNEDIFYANDIIQDWFSSGGELTYNVWDNLNDSQKRQILKQINTLRFTATYNSPNGHSVILEHAGYTPTNKPRRGHDPLWDRNHFHDFWEEQENLYLVHGHTPVQYLNYEFGYNGKSQRTQKDMAEKKDWKLGRNLSSLNHKVIRYCDGHKFDIDLCTIISKCGVLLNLDTFEEIYFEEK